jgi:hypothetical protein
VTTRPKVILRRSQRCDPGRIAAIACSRMDELGVRPVHRTMVIAHRRLFAHAFTRSECLDGLLQTLEDRGEGMTDPVVGERCGITVPTRYSFSMAGYPRVLKRH